MVFIMPTDPGGFGFSGTGDLGVGSDEDFDLENMMDELFAPDPSGGSSYGTDYSNFGSNPYSTPTSQYGSQANLGQPIGTQPSGYTPPPSGSGGYQSGFVQNPMAYGDPNAYNNPSLATGSGYTSTGYNVGNPNQTFMQDYYSGMAAEQTRHNKAMEDLDNKKYQLQQQLQQAQLAAAKNPGSADSAAAQQAAQQYSAQLAQIEQAKVQLERENMQLQQRLQEQQLAQNAQQMGLTDEQFQAQLALSRDQFNQQIKQFDATFGQGKAEFDANMAYQLWNAGQGYDMQKYSIDQNVGLGKYQTDANTGLGYYRADQDYDLGLRNNDLGYYQAGNAYDLGLRNVDLGYRNANITEQLGNRNIDLGYDRLGLDRDRLGLDTQNSNFNQSVKLSELAANPRNLTQSLMLLGYTPSAARSVLASSPYTQTWMNNPSQLDKQRYSQPVPFQYADNDQPFAFLPNNQGNATAPNYQAPQPYQPHN